MTTTMNASKYDCSMERAYTFYDQLPYERNLSICGNDCIQLFSGNVIKVMTYTDDAVMEIPNQEGALFAKIRHQQELLRLESERSEQQELLEEAM